MDMVDKKTLQASLVPGFYMQKYIVEVQRIEN